MVSLVDAMVYVLNTCLVHQYTVDRCLASDNIVHYTTR